MSGYRYISGLIIPIANNGSDDLGELLDEHYDTHKGQLSTNYEETLLIYTNVNEGDMVTFFKIDIPMDSSASPLNQLIDEAGAMIELLPFKINIEPNLALTYTEIYWDGSDADVHLLTLADYMENF